MVPDDTCMVSSPRRETVLSSVDEDSLRKYRERSRVRGRQRVYCPYLRSSEVGLTSPRGPTVGDQGITDRGGGVGEEEVRSE